MTPTDIQPTTNRRRTILTFRLDHAISNKGMGISLPTVTQPGEATNAVLGEVEPAWLLIFAMLVLGLTLGGVEHAILASAFFATAAACGYGLLGDCSDILLGFWGTAVLVLVPGFAGLAWLLTRMAPQPPARVLALQLLLFGIVYPCAAGLDSDRQSLYLNIAVLVFLGFAAWQLIGRFQAHGPQAKTTSAPNAAMA